MGARTECFVGEVGTILLEAAALRAAARAIRLSLSMILNFVSHAR